MAPRETKPKGRRYCDDYRQQLCQVHPGIDGKVRRVSIQYKNKDSDTFITIDRPVERLVVILPVDEHV